MCDESTVQSCDRMCRYCNNASGKCPASCTTDADFLMSSAELKQRLGSFASSIQNAVTPNKDGIKD